jgi:hypothetical protein
MSRALAALDDAVANAARGMTRRRLVRRASAAALGLAYGTAFLWQRPDLSGANHNACSGVHCSSTRCYDSGYCHNTTRTGRRGYNTNYCIGSSGGVACWSNNGYRCCDCCADYNTGSFSCQLCGGFFWACGCYGPI